MRRRKRVKDHPMAEDLLRNGLSRAAMLRIHPIPDKPEVLDLTGVNALMHLAETVREHKQHDLAVAALAVAWDMLQEEPGAVRRVFCCPEVP